MRDTPNGRWLHAYIIPNEGRPPGRPGADIAGDEHAGHPGTLEELLHQARLPDPPPPPDQHALAAHGGADDLVEHALEGPQQIGELMGTPASIVASTSRRRTPHAARTPPRCPVQSRLRRQPHRRSRSTTARTPSDGAEARPSVATLKCHHPCPNSRPMLIAELRRRSAGPGTHWWPQCWIRPPTGTGATWPVAGRVCARARPTSTSDDRRREATSGIGVQTDSAVSPFDSGRSCPPVMRTR
jgi:hypothetical protein